MPAQRIRTYFAVVLLGPGAVWSALPVPCGTQPASLPPNCPSHPCSWDEVVPGAGVPVTVYLAQPLNVAVAAPTILVGHGFGSYRKETDDPLNPYPVFGHQYGAFFPPRGYNVVTMDFRGHGDFQHSYAEVLNPEAEIQDVRMLLDWLGEQSWALCDAPGDPLVGGAGGSYGGGWQMLLLGEESPLDAIAAEVTWSDLLRSLAPNDVIKHRYLNVLAAIGNGDKVNLHPDIEEAFLAATASNSLGGMRDLLRDRSPSDRPAWASEVPTLLIQGMSDMLFTPKEGIENFKRIRGRGAAARLVTQLSDHGLEQPVPSHLDSQVCGDRFDHMLEWFDNHLGSLMLPIQPLPDVHLGLDSGCCFSRLGDLTAEDLIDQEGDMTGLGSRIWNGLSDRVVVHTASERTLVAGIPVLRGAFAPGFTQAGPALEPVVHFSLHVVSALLGERHLGYQVVPVRFSDLSNPGAFAVELGPVGTELLPGDRLELAIEPSDLMFDWVAGGNPNPGGVLSDLSLALHINALEDRPLVCRAPLPRRRVLAQAWAPRQIRPIETRLQAQLAEAREIVRQAERNIERDLDHFVRLLAEARDAAEQALAEPLQDAVATVADLHAQAVSLRRELEAELERRRAEVDERRRGLERALDQLEDQAGSQAAGAAEVVHRRLAWVEQWRRVVKSELDRIQSELLILGVELPFPALQTD